MARSTVTGNPTVYGRAHRAGREAALADLARFPGRPCRKCWRPMFVGQRLDYGHPDNDPARSGGTADELEHSACNRADGARVTNMRRRRRALPEW